MATTLLESGARPYGSSKGVFVSMILHGALITAAVLGTAKVVLPPREKVEEHPILYVAPPPPKPVQMAAEPLPAVKAPPKAKAPEKVFKAPPTRRAPQPQPVVQPKTPPTPALNAPAKVSISLAAVDLKTVAISDISVPTAPEPAIKGSGISRDGSVKSDGEGEGGGSKGGLGSGSSGRAYDENQVDRAVQVTRQTPPRYPDALRSVGVEGVVSVRFIVGADGRVESGSIDVLSTPNKLFSEAVRSSLLNSRYRPAEAGGRAVRQLVEQSFTFRLDKQ